MMTAPTMIFMAEEPDDTALATTPEGPEGMTAVVHPLPDESASLPMAWTVEDYEEYDSARCPWWMVAIIALVLIACATAAVIGIVQWSGVPAVQSRQAAVAPTAPSAVVQTVAPPLTLQSVDDQYVSRLRAAGLTVYEPADAVNSAHYICSHLASGESRADLIYGERRDNPQMEDMSSVYVNTAIDFYCPQYAGR